MVWPRRHGRLSERPADDLVPGLLGPAWPLDISGSLYVEATPTAWPVYHTFKADPLARLGLQGCSAKARVGSRAAPSARHARPVHFSRRRWLRRRGRTSHGLPEVRSRPRPVKNRRRRVIVDADPLLLFCTSRPGPQASRSGASFSTLASASVSRSLQSGHPHQRSVYPNATHAPSV